VIRELRDEDVPAVVALIHELQPHWLMTEAAFRHGLAARPARLRYLRLVAEEDGEIVAWSAASLSAYEEAAETGYPTASVRTDRRRRGIGGALFERALAHLRSVGARRALAEALDDDGRHFLEARGFGHSHTRRMSKVDLRRADLSEIDELRVSKAAEGFTVRPYADCRPEDVHRIVFESARDTPSDEPMDFMPYDEWLARHWSEPRLCLEGSFAVLYRDRTVSHATLWADLERGLGENAGTGTLREFRRRGLARLAKLSLLQWAAANGITSIVTDNDEANPAMLGLNERLGYVPFGEVHSFVRELG
jgi:GNAT superfamily N-acetyltransferase